MTFYSHAADGSLTETELSGYLDQIDEPSRESGNGTRGLTPLALAARNGYVDAVRLLLSKGAAPDACSSQNRTPLWMVTARGRGDSRAEIVDLLLKGKANAKYSHPDLLGGSTPLENELKQLRNSEVIHLLVEQDGTTDTAIKLAGELGDPEIDDAMKSTQQRSKLRATIVDLILSLILFILAWANSPGLAGMANKIFQKFQISGNKSSATAQKIAIEVPEPKTKDEFKKSINSFVHKHKLQNFFPTADSPLLETLVSKAVDLQNDDTSVLGQSTNTENLVKFALYQPVIYCDDSGSMAPENNDRAEDRMADQRDLVQRIASICTQVVPDELGVHLRFINEELPPSEANDLRMDAVKNIMSNVEAKGLTEIGTNLRKRILEPLLYNGVKMTRPLFVSIITDGIPYGGKSGTSEEKRNTLRNEIVKCQEYLLNNGLPPRAVTFQLSQIGSDPESKEFLDSLANDPRLKGSLYVTAQQLDSKYRDLRGNERDLEAWLFQTLLTPVLDIRDG